MGELSRRQWSARRVLVLEDERSVRRAFQLMLVDEGLAVDVAATTEEAVSRLERGAYEVLILDTAMAGSERQGLLDVLRRRFPTLAVVIATGEPTAFMAAQRHPNVDAVLAKPVPRERLIDSLAEAMRTRMQRSGTRLRRATGL